MDELARTASDVAAEHQEIVRGYDSLYRLLVDLDYVQNKDVQVPPHGLPKDPVAVVQLRAAGLDPRTIELIGRLPAFTNHAIALQRSCTQSENGVPVAPSSSGTSYLLGSGRQDEARDVGACPVGGNGVLPTSAFRLASACSPQGFDLAYDMNDKTIIKWHPGNWAKCQKIPVAQFMDDWIAKIQALTWLPWRDGSGWAIQEQPVGCAEMVAAQRTALDHYWDRRRIYEECGWPKSFDQEKFRQRRDEWNAKAKDIGCEGSPQHRDR